LTTGIVKRTADQETKTAMTQEQLLNTLQSNPFLLAPMAGITDSPFRSFMKEMGCGFVITELVSAKALQTNHLRSQQLMKFEENQRPVGVQIFGEDLEALHTAAQIVEQAGVDFVDLNFGCPVQKIIKKGAGSATLKDLSMLRKILKTVRQAVSIPVSIKIRTGWNADSRNSDQVTRIASEEGIMWMAIHGRTRAQGYSGQADWNYIATIKQQSSIPIIGNGDLIHPDQIIKLKQKTQCDGMMIGRGCLKNPWIFQDTQKIYNAQRNSLLTQQPIQKPSSQQYYHHQKSTQQLPHRNIHTVLQRLRYHLENFYDQPMFLLQYKKFCAWYSAGFPNSSTFRQEIFQTKNKKDILDKVDYYFSALTLQNKQNIAYEPALMQGHG